MSTTIVYAGTGNGNVRNSGATYSTVRSAATGDAVQGNTAGDVAWIRTQLFSGTYYIIRGFFPFDTSAIPDGDTVTAGVVSSYVANHSNPNSPSVCMVQTSQADPTTLTTADFDQCGSVDSPTEGMTRVLISSLTDSQYNDFTMNATGLTFINKTGNTLIGFRTSLDVDNSAPTGNNDFAAFLVGAASSANRPYITVTHAAAGPAGVKTFDGVTQSTGIKTYMGVTTATSKTVNGVA